MNLEDLKTDGYWYLATPYSNYRGGLEIAFKHACDVAGELLKHGLHIYCPIAHTHPIAVNGGIDPYSHELFIPLDKHFMNHAHGLMVVQMPGWEESKGIEIEVDVFVEQKKPIVTLTWPLVTVENYMGTF